MFNIKIYFFLYELKFKEEFLNFFLPKSQKKKIQIFILFYFILFYFF